MLDDENKNLNGSGADFFKDDSGMDDFFAKLQSNNGEASTNDAEVKKEADENTAEKKSYRSDAAEAKNEGAPQRTSAKKKKRTGLDAFLYKLGIDTDKSGNSGRSGGSRYDDKPKKELTKGQKVWRVIWRTVLSIFCVCVIIGCVLSVAVAIYLVDATADDDSLLDLNELKLSYSTVLMAKNKETGEWEEYERIYGGENRVWVNYADMPKCLIDAAVAKEDKRFWSHHGVDWRGTGYAFFSTYIAHSSNARGGSTITQQLIKNITNEKAVSGIEGPLRKIREIYRAIMLEKNYSKEQIMEAYLNTFRLSGQLGGVEAGANYFFGKTTSELTAAESAAIVCITQNPSVYGPIENPENNKKDREDVVLYLMNQQGLLSDADYQAALAESANLVFHEGDLSGENDVYSYFTDTAISEILKDLVKYNKMTPEEASDLFFTGGLKVYLTIDTDIQKTMEEYAYNPDNWPKLLYEDDGVTLKEDKYQNQAAMVVMDYNANLLGIIGGVREKTESRGFNRAYSALRQPGSSMKPIAVYAPGIELNYINYSTLIEDAPCEIDDNGDQWPRNYDRVFGYYGSSVTVYKAIGVSLNTVAVKVLKMVGAETAYGFCETKFGISSLVDLDDNVFDTVSGKRMIDKTLSLGLGGLTYGATPYEMCAAYVPFGNGGTYYTPHCYSQVVNSNGEVILDSSQTIQEVQAISEQTAFIMNQLLQGVAREGTAYDARTGKLPQAGKTGTSSDAKDFWLMMMNPYYCMTMWQGYDEPAYMSTSIRVTKQAVKSIMGTISADLEYKEFPSCSEGIFTAQVCTASGDYASAECPSTMTGYYKTGNGPTQTCVHSLAPVQEVKSEADFNVD